MSMENSRWNNMSRNGYGHEAPNREQPLMQKDSSMTVQPTTTRQKSVKFNMAANEEFPMRRSYSKGQGLWGKLRTVMRCITGSKGKKHRGGGSNGRVRDDRAIEIEENEDDKCHENNQNIDEVINETNRTRRSDGDSRGRRDGGDEGEERNPRQRREEEEKEDEREDEGGRGEDQLSIVEPIPYYIQYHYEFRRGTPPPPDPEFTVWDSLKFGEF